MVNNVCSGKAAEMLLDFHYSQLKHLLSMKRASNQACGDALSSDFTTYFQVHC